MERGLEENLLQNNNDGPATQAPDVSTAGNTFRYSRAYANYVLGVLFVVYVFNFVDRQVVSVLIGPIKEEFGASDTQMGLLIGFAFALFIPSPASRLLAGPIAPTGATSSHSVWRCGAR